MENKKRRTYREQGIYRQAENRECQKKIVVLSARCRIVGAF